MASPGHDASALPMSCVSKLDQGKEPSRNLSEFGAALNLLKFMIGLGIISLPEATSHVGWLPSIIGLGVVAFITVWGIFFALEARTKLEKLEQDAHDTQTAIALTEGDPLLASGSWQDMPDSGCGFFDKIVGKVLGRPAQYIFAASIALGQFTTIVMYVNVITVNIESYFPGSLGDYHVQVLMSLVLVLGIFSLTPTLQGVAVLSAVGLSIYAFLFIGLVHEIVDKVIAGVLPASAVMVKQGGEVGYGQWFGVACFSFSAFPGAMVVYEDMRNPRSFHLVIGGVFFTAWLVYSTFAFAGYLCFGDQTDVLLYFNFERGTAYRNFSALALACILTFSFIIQAIPVFNCATKLWDATGLAGKLGAEGLPSLPFIRWAVLALTVVVAYLVPSIKVLMGTLGALSGVIAGFIFPALTYLRLSTRDEWLPRCRCFLVLVIGVMGAWCSSTGQ